MRRNVSKPSQVGTLGNSAKPAGIAALYKESYGTALTEGDDLGARARQRGAQLRDYAQTCQGFVGDIERAVSLLDSIAQEQEQVRRLHSLCDRRCRWTPCSLSFSEHGCPFNPSV